MSNESQYIRLERLVSESGGRHLRADRLEEFGEISPLIEERLKETWLAQEWPLFMGYVDLAGHRPSPGCVPILCDALVGNHHDIDTPSNYDHEAVAESLKKGIEKGVAAYWDAISALTEVLRSGWKEWDPAIAAVCLLALHKCETLEARAELVWAAKCHTVTIRELASELLGAQLMSSESVHDRFADHRNSLVDIDLVTAPSENIFIDLLIDAEEDFLTGGSFNRVIEFSQTFGELLNGYGTRHALDLVFVGPGFDLEAGRFELGLEQKHLGVRSAVLAIGFDGRLNTVSSMADLAGNALELIKFNNSDIGLSDDVSFCRQILLRMAE
ncbi:hypothetical protein Lfu02_77690 [Longispora fulva]|uniref:Uncharacterized protein n=1 Tax=Longispora fulva TaxID=619741 RepID=A0A8J7GSH2_9ACTN|nr:hypothetical protein [Longispora fulva]MBG6136216.1 hypothetical protein [Longispora fulva]GIG63397.1 hypothetical protein Lfu02_77690 [Longispora fulva]